jgi:hypothetical protein
MRDLDEQIRILIDDVEPVTVSEVLTEQHQRRRFIKPFVALGAVAAACTALALGLTGAFSATPTRTSNALGSASAPSGGRTIVRTAAFILTSNVNGTDALTLTRGQFFDAAALQQALTDHGIPALVKSGSVCTSHPAPTAGTGALSIQTRTDRTVTVFNPAAFPSGVELFVGYSSTGRSAFTTLIYANSHTCSKSP